MSYQSNSKTTFIIMMNRERTVQPKLDRSDSVLFSRVRPAIQYRSSTDRLVGGGRFQVTCIVGLSPRLLPPGDVVNGYSADWASVHNSVAVCICLLVLSWAALNSRSPCTEVASALRKCRLTPAIETERRALSQSPHHAVGRSDSGIFS